MKHLLLNKFYPSGFEKPYNKNILRNDVNMVNKLIELTSFLSTSVTYSERLYCLLHDLTEEKKCECGNLVKFLSQSQGYRKFCSKKCSITSEKTREKIRKTTIQSQGGLGFASKKISDKVKHTNLKKYGFENAMSNDEIRNKAQETYDLLDKDEILKKRKTTNLKKYGFEHHQQNTFQKEKIKNVLLEKYDGIGFASKTISDKVKQTNLEKFGFENAMSNQDVKDNLKKTIMIKYGVENISEVGNELWNEFKKNFNSETFVLNNSLQEMEQKYGVRYYTISLFLQQYGFNFSTISSYEQELRNFLPDDFIFNDRKILNGKELDFFSPTRNLAIEFNGILHHSEKYGKTENYHNNKTSMCHDKNIQLIHIFENEWLEKKAIVKSIINAKLGKFVNKIQARKTKIVELDSKTKNNFLIENHLQGKDSSSIKLGLLYDNELVSVMTFGSPRFNKNYQFELHRFANKIDTQVIGGASKLWQYFIKKYNPLSVITYADRRYSNGLLYEKIGFKFENISKPNFWVIGNNIKSLESRLGWQKHKLPKKLKNFNPLLSAWDNMLENGYNRIWDCGNFVFIWKKN